MKYIMKSKLKFLAAAVLASSMLFTGCGGDSSTSADSTAKKTINISMHQDPPKLDPYYSAAFVEIQVFQSIFDRLVDIAPDGKIAPSLAEKWDVTDDGLKYTFHLRKGVKFHDGTDFDAEAVKFNIERYQEKGSSRKNEVISIKNVNVVDAHTVEFILDKPFAPLLYVLADRAGMIVSPTAVKKLGDGFMNAPVGTGAYMFKSRVKGNSITVTKNPNYWRADKPVTENIVYKIIDDANVALVNLKSGQVDMTNKFPLNEVNNYGNDKKVTVINEAGPGFRGMAMNTSKELFEDVRVRKAIEMLIDRETLVKVALSGVGTPGRTALPPKDFAFAYSKELDSPDGIDIEGAKKLLAEAGKSNGFKFTLATDTDPVSQQVAQLLQKQLSVANIEVVIDRMDFGSLLGNVAKGSFQAALVGWSGYIDPDQNFYDWLHTGARMNYMRYSDPEMDAWLEKARTLNDQAERKEIYTKVMEKALADSPYIYLYHDHNVLGMSRDVQDFTPLPNGTITTYNMHK